MVPEERLRACIIGAGPSGLVSAKYLLESSSSSRRFDVTILEASGDLGGTFRNKVYDNARLVSSKYITAFSDFRMPADYPNHPTMDQYVDYLEEYCNQFGIRECIRFHCTVVSVKDDAAANDNEPFGYTVDWIDSSQVPSTHHCEPFDVVLVCSGLHNVPSVPTNIQNLNAFRGISFHSSSYKEASVFSGKRVLVVGSGETAMDLAMRAIQTRDCVQVGMSVRRGFLSIPHNLAQDRPLDVFITNLFEHSYEHPWIHALKWRWILSTWIIRLFLCLTGSSQGFNQWACSIAPTKRGHHVINKSHEAMAHLNVPVKQKTWIGRFWMWVSICRDCFVFLCSYGYLSLTPW